MSTQRLIFPVLHVYASDFPEALLLFGAPNAFSERLVRVFTAFYIFSPLTTYRFELKGEQDASDLPRLERIQACKKGRRQNLSKNVRLLCL